MTAEQEILEDALVAVRQRVATFAEQLERHAPGFPLPTDGNLDERPDLWMHMDAFSKRFEMTQDQIVRKLFRSVLAVQQGVVYRTKALGEVIDGVARLGIVENAAEWHEITKLRNSLAHDYIADRSEVARRLNQAWTVAPKLIAMLDRIEQYIVAHRLLDQSDADD